MKNRNIKGQIISPGIEMGETYFVVFPFSSISPVEKLSRRKPDMEIARFEKETNSLVSELEEAVKSFKKDSYFEDAEIVQTHIFLLRDKGFQRRVKDKIKTHRLTAEAAVEKALQEIIEVLESSGSSVFSERSSDFKDILMRLKKKLAKEEAAIFKKLLNKSNNPVVVTKELFPSLVLEAKKEGAKAFLIEEGTSLSHAAIMAKSFGLPVLKIENLYAHGLRDKTKVLVDADNGRLVINPGKMEVDWIDSIRQPKDFVKTSLLPVKIWINITDPTQLKKNDLENVEGIGLYRTESPFMEKEDFPDEDEQYQVYSVLFEKAGDRLVTIRTLDIGGDKTLPYFSFGPQENPYLGFRAHRIYRFHPEIFITQMRAILRAGANSSKLRVLFPMIENVDELLFVQDLLRKAILSLKEEGIKHNHNFQQGVLVEVPSAVWDFKRLLSFVDFASLGTNDLLQYFFAVDRNNANVTGSYWPENPTSLRMLKGLVETAREMGKSLNICGEIASDVRFLPLLVGLGFKHISIDSHAVSYVRESLSSLDVCSCIQLAQECLRAEKVSEVKAILDTFKPHVTEHDTSSLKKQTESIDPVCGMVVHSKGNKLSVVLDGRTHYFCSKQCRDKFTKNKRS